MSPEARAIIQAARHADDPSGRQLRRVGRALVLRLGVGTSVVLASGTAWGAFWTKLAVAVVVAGLGGVGTGLWWNARHGSDAPAPTPAPVSAVTEAPVFAVAPSDLLASPAPPRPIVHRLSRRTAPAKRSTLSAPPVPSAPAIDFKHLREEVTILTEVNRQLENGRKNEALGLLNEYDRRFPGGVLHEESEAARAIVHCQLIGGRDAIAQAQSFKARHARSPLLNRVEHACVGFND